MKPAGQAGLLCCRLCARTSNLLHDPPPHFGRRLLSESQSMINILLSKNCLPRNGWVTDQTAGYLCLGKLTHKINHHGVQEEWASKSVGMQREQPASPRQLWEVKTNLIL